VKKAFPSAYCKPLEWVSTAADRRCDDGKISVAGLSARLTVYLKTGSIQGIAVRFDSKDRDRIIGHLKSRWGPPAAEKTETIARKAKDGKGKEDRKVFKVNWEKGDERALLTAQSDRKRAQLDVWRGNFYDEIYKGTLGQIARLRYRNATITPRITIRIPSSTSCLTTVAPGIGCTT
jgi:hypothetical protein